MTFNETYSPSFFDAFVSISGFGVGEIIWEKYQKHTIPKIKKAVVTLKGVQSMVKNLTPKQAKKELEALDKIKPAISKVWKDIEKINHSDFTQFKNETIIFFEELNILYTSLQDVAYPNTHNKFIEKALLKTWDKEVVDWNKYLE